MFKYHRFFLPPACLAFSLAIVSCGGSGSSGTSLLPTPTPSATPTPTPTSLPTPGSSITISGTVTYDLVPHTNRGSLDYDATSREPVRGATVQLLDANGNEVDSAVLNEEGEYSLVGLSSNLYRVRVLSELRQDEGVAAWDFKVTDNTQANAIYALDGSLVSSGLSDSRRDLHAASGWGGSSYTDTRSAAPFAILDSVYQALEMLLDIDNSIQLSPTELRWSVNNKAINGNLADGDIGTSFYTGGEQVMYILGDANSDTDEYDRSVIQHELTHYLEDTQSRSDSIGGAHSLNSSTDMRVAFSEGLANAFTAFASGSGSYSDSSGPSQNSGFLFSIENSSSSDNLGWYSENSVGQLVYDIADNQNDGSDTLSLGFGPVWEALTSNSYVNSDALISIYVFASELEKVLPNSQFDVFSEWLDENDIMGSGAYGDNETNNGGFVLNLPVYSSLVVGETVEVCTNNALGEYNFVDNRRFIRFQLSESRDYQISVTSNSSSEFNNDPDAVLFSNGVFINQFISEIPNSEVSTQELDAGEYVLEVYAFENVDNQAFSGGFACFDVSVQ